MQLTIESVKPTKTGKSLGVKASGKEYLAKLDSGVQVGMVIDAEIETNEYNGKTYTWIGKYKPVQAVPMGGQHVVQTSNGTAWLPFASNTVAHAINAGLIKGPSEVKVWAAAAKQAFEELTA